MAMRMAMILTGLAFLAACGAADGEGSATVGAGDSAGLELPGAQVALACEPSAMPLEGRASPYDSTFVDLGGVQAKLCYGRPSARERAIFGGLVPYDDLWRTGANEPTTIHLPVAAQIAGLPLEPGSYSIYTVPGAEEWMVVVNASTSQWGIEDDYTSIEEHEIGRGAVPAETIPEHVETFTITSEVVGPGATDLVLTWERTRVRIPIRRT